MEAPNWLAVIRPPLHRRQTATSSSVPALNRKLTSELRFKSFIPAFFPSGSSSYRMKYVDNTRIFHLHVPTGYTSAMFTHLPSRTVFIDSDRYIDESLGYWLAHELGHLVTNSAKEQDAEKAAHEFRKRLKQAHIETR
jgi:hypothetical protein